MTFDFNKKTHRSLILAIIKLVAKRKPFPFAVGLVMLLATQNSMAQAPNISYSPSTYVLIQGVTYSLSPTNTGGTVPVTTNGYGYVTTIAGNGTNGNVNNTTGTSAEFNLVHGLALDGIGNLYVADVGNFNIRKIALSGTFPVTPVTLTFSGGASFFTTGGTGGNGPDDIAFDGTTTNLYEADNGGNVINKIVLNAAGTTGTVTTFAGKGSASSSDADGTGTGAGLFRPVAITYDAASNAFYISDQSAPSIRKMTTSGVVTTIATNGMHGPYKVAVDDATGDLYLPQYQYNDIIQVVPGATPPTSAVINTFAGPLASSSSAPAAGTTDGSGTAVGFSTPEGFTKDISGNFYVADVVNNRIRMITPAGVVTTVAGSTAGYLDGVGTSALFNDPVSITLDQASGLLYIADKGNLRVRTMGTFGYSISNNTVPANNTSANAGLPTGLSFNYVTGVISGTITGTLSPSTQTFTITAFNANGSSATTVTLSTPTSDDWLGKNSTDWHTASNWSAGAVPTTTNGFAARIGMVAYTGAADQPTVSSTSGSTAVTAIAFGTHNTPVLTINSGLTLTANSGIQVVSSSTSTVKGPGILAIGNGSGCASNIASGGTFSLASNAVMSLGTSSGLTNSGTFTIGSDVNGSSSISAIPSGASVNGTVTVQRYITGGSGYRGYRLISSPVYAATVSSNNVYSINYLKTGSYITGANGGGFDQGGNPTLYLYREDQIPLNASFTDGNFWGISAINNSPTYNYSVTGGNPSTTSTFNIPVGNGLMFFFRGNRASASIGTETQPSYTTPVTVTMSTSGTLNQGQVIVHNWYTPSSNDLGNTTITSGSLSNSAIRGFNLVGNPYPSSIDWETYSAGTSTAGIYAPLVGNTVYEWNPTTKNYATYMAGHGGTTNNGQEYIMSGEGFFVKATSSSAQLIFNEAAKVTNQTTGVNLFMAEKRALDAAFNAAPDEHLRLQIAADTVNTDDTYIGFNAAASPQYVFNEDAPYLTGSGLVRVASFSSDSVKLAINKMPLPGLKQITVPIFATSTAYGTYKLNMTEIKGIPTLFEIWLMDRFKSDSLDMRHNTTYAFDVTTDTGSYGAHRFQLVIRQDAALMVHLLSFSAAKTNNGAQVAWVTENEDNYTGFTVERSTDNGVTFTDLSSLASNSAGNYGFLDKSPAMSADEYRLKITDLNGTISYSNIVTLMYANTSGIVKNAISVYPNPAKTTLNLSITPAVVTAQAVGANAAGGAVYTIKIVNNLGSVVKTASTAGSDWQTDVSDLTPGNYVIQVVNSSNKNVVGTGKFIKL